MSQMPDVARRCPSKLFPLAWVGPVAFCVEEVLRTLPVPGVYVFHAVATGLGAHAILYAGQSADLRSRLIQHLKGDYHFPNVVSARPELAVCVSTAPVFDVEFRRGVLAGLVRGLRPAFNCPLPYVAAIPVNLPPFISLTGEEYEA